MKGVVYLKNIESGYIAGSNGYTAIRMGKVSIDSKGIINIVNGNAVIESGCDIVLIDCGIEDSDANEIEYNKKCYEENGCAIFDWGEYVILVGGHSIQIWKGVKLIGEFVFDKIDIEWADMDLVISLE